MYYINKPKRENVKLMDTYTEREESKYNHIKKIEISKKTAVLMTISFFLMSCAKAFCVEVVPDVTCWDGAGNKWTCSNCGRENYCWEMSCNNCGNFQ